MTPGRTRLGVRLGAGIGIELRDGAAPLALGGGFVDLPRPDDEARP